ncbi:MAG: MOSC domain-containing protein [Rhizobiaceae bacterium]|nr:MAG: MOSC domain-containing protein [Rhizobiaceae bacterium]
MEIVIRTLLAGAVAPLGDQQVPSGIDKQPLAGRHNVGINGLAGDAQGDTKHHGGPEKALHHYAFDHYARWRTDHPGLRPRLAQPGAFGENISTLGMTEADVCIGDVYRLGTARVQVSQGRQPCWRLNERFDNPAMARLVQETGRTGWYYRVREEGSVAAGDMIRLIERPLPDWPLTRVIDLLYRHTLDTAALAELAELPQLATSWRDLAGRRLKSRAVENWSSRLETPA